MISRFFIDRPIFAAVLSIVITLAGGVSVLSLPLAQYPEIAPPTIQVSCNYPGANASVVADTVAAPIEQQVNGVEKMLYMSSLCTNDGAYNLTVTFAVGTNLKIALVQVQNRVQLAMPQLPQQVQEQGVNVKKKSPGILLSVNLISPHGRYNNIYLSNYLSIQVKDEIARLYGVGDITMLGERDYSIRAWLDPEKLAARNLGVDDVVNAVQQQNNQVVSGQLGQPPMVTGQLLQQTVTALGRLTDTEQFGDIIVKTGAQTPSNPVTPVVRLRDIARMELAAQQYTTASAVDRHEAVTLGIYQLPGTNALQTAQGVRKKMEELSKRFPEDIEYRIVYDTTPFITQSIEEVLKTLRDAVILVAVVVLVFLQNWRAAFIPLVAVPVAIIGTFAAMAALGFSLNNLSLFGLVLAIGIVVDDAIVVVENVERWLNTGLPAREAAIKAMEEVTGPVVAVALVLCAVFVPCAFISGITGQFFRQFALTIAVSTVISAFNSLTLSPALAALLLKPHGGKRDPLTWLLDTTLGWFFRLFNGVFGISTSIYTRIVGLLLRGSMVALLVYGGLLVLTYWGFTHVPTGFIPPQDKGYLVVNVELPESASLERTQQVMDHIAQIAQATPGVAHTMSISGMSLLLTANSPNFGSMYVIFEDFAQRRSPEKHTMNIVQAIRARCEREIREARISVFGPPPVDGLGTAGGFKLMIEDRRNLGLDALQESLDDVLQKGNQLPEIASMFSIFRARIPQLFLDIDRLKVRSLGIPLQEVFNALQVYMGGKYINQFNEFGRSWQVNLMADGPYRAQADEVRRLKVRNAKGLMVPLATLADVRDAGGPVLMMRYNLFPAAPINGSARAGISSGDLIDQVTALADRELPESMTFEWTELMYMQILAGNTAMYVFAFAVVLVFLVLAGQYESWSLPLAVILVVPMCLLCSIVGVVIAHMDINTFVQIGLVVLVGLASKNAILIVEFAKQQRESGTPRREATLEACRLRLRPILMTSFAFILGVVPLVVAEGAGSEMRRSLGIAVFSGMLGVTVFGIFLTPVFFYVIEGLQSPFSRDAKRSA